MCVYVCETERERKRMCVCVCVCVHTCTCLCVGACLYQVKDTIQCGYVYAIIHVYARIQNQPDSKTSVSSLVKEAIHMCMHTNILVHIYIRLTFQSFEMPCKVLTVLSAFRRFICTSRAILMPLITGPLNLIHMCTSMFICTCTRILVCVATTRIIITI